MPRPERPSPGVAQVLVTGLWQISGPTPGSEHEGVPEPEPEPPLGGVQTFLVVLIVPLALGTIVVGAGCRTG
jgi:hypothetical protein